MAKTAWIAVSELGDYLTALGLSSVPAGISLQDEIDGATAAVHTATDIAPYLAGSEASYDYDAPGTRVLYFGAPFATITVVRVNKSNSYAGDALVEGVDYWPKQSGGSYEQIYFASSQSGDPESIEVTGRKGKVTDIPVDLWKAHRDYAASAVLSIGIATGVVSQGPASRIKQGGVDIEFGNGSKTIALDVSLKESALKVFSQYRRRACVGLAP